MANAAGYDPCQFAMRFFGSSEETRGVVTRPRTAALDAKSA